MIIFLLFFTSGSIFGNLDLFLGRGSQTTANKVWFQSGNIYQDSGQSLGEEWTNGTALGDLDGDGDFDAAIVNTENIEIWLNDGQGHFTIHDTLSINIGKGVALGDLDDDGDLDLVTVHSFIDNGRENHVWKNDGHANFSQFQAFGDFPSFAVALEDFDCDGDLDVAVANSGSAELRANNIWFNDGDGNLSLGQSLGSSHSVDVIARDIDNDGDVDLIFANLLNSDGEGEPTDIWLNDGHGVFTFNQEVGGRRSHALESSDFDRDGFPDFVVGNTTTEETEIWMNDGTGLFTGPNITLDGFFDLVQDFSVVDVNNDQWPDLFAAASVGSSRLFVNQGELDGHWQGFVEVMVFQGNTFSVSAGDLRRPTATTLRAIWPLDASVLDCVHAVNGQNGLPELP